MPKYEEIANSIRDAIESGVYPVDSLLPTQEQLAEQFGVSRMTVKKAIELLTIEGLVFSRQGNGTKVLNVSFWNRDDGKLRLNNFNGLTKDLERDPRQLTSKIIAFAVEFPQQAIADKLQLELSAPVYRIIRLRCLDEEPYVLEHIYMPVDLVPGLDEAVLSQSIYRFLWEELDLKFAGSYRHLTAERADTYDQQHLNCRETDPVLQVEQVVYLENGRPIEYSRVRNRFDTRGYSLLDVNTL